MTNLLVGAGQIGALLLHDPLLAGDARHAAPVLALLARPQPNGLVGLDGGGAHLLLHAHLLARHVGARPLEQPLVARRPLRARLVREVEHRPQLQRRVGRDHLERRDRLLQHLARVQRERVLAEADLQVGEDELGLARRRVVHNLSCMKEK